MTATLKRQKKLVLANQKVHLVQKKLEKVVWQSEGMLTGVLNKEIVFCSFSIYQHTLQIISTVTVQDNVLNVLIEGDDMVVGYAIGLG